MNETNEDITMKAVRFHAYGGADKLVLENVILPEPGQGEVLVRIHAVAVNPWDWKFRSEGIRM